MSAGEISDYLGEVQELVLAELASRIPQGTRYDRDLYDPMRAYPFRDAKGLRPTLCVAVCRALGGRLEAILPTAAVVELYHNAFLVHDDVEDGSLQRRGGPTLHTELGMPAAVNVGDGMLALCLRPLLDNTHLLGLGPALHILESIASMSEQTVQGQALELGWIRRGEYGQSDRDYLRMVHQKTTWYTFLTPIRVGTLIAGTTPAVEGRLRLWGTLLGSAFQIQDDVLNLQPDNDAYGKESNGDLWEGKRTLILGHCLRALPPGDRKEAERLLSRPRPTQGRTDGCKTEGDVLRLRSFIDQTGSLDYAIAAAARRARRSARILDGLLPVLGKSVHFDFLVALTDYVWRRGR